MTWHHELFDSGLGWPSTFVLCVLMLLAIRLSRFLSHQVKDDDDSAS